MGAKFSTLSWSHHQAASASRPNTKSIAHDEPVRRSVPSTPCRTFLFHGACTSIWIRFRCVTIWMRSHCVRSDCAYTSGAGSQVALSVAQCHMKCETPHFSAIWCVTSASPLIRQRSLCRPQSGSAPLSSTKGFALSRASLAVCRPFESSQYHWLLGAGQSKQSHIALQNSMSTTSW